MPAVSHMLSRPACATPLSAGQELEGARKSPTKPWWLAVSALSALRSQHHQPHRGLSSECLWLCCSPDQAYAASKVLLGMAGVEVRQFNVQAPLCIKIE